MSKNSCTANTLSFLHSILNLMRNKKQAANNRQCIRLLPTYAGAKTDDAEEIVTERKSSRKSRIIFLPVQHAEGEHSWPYLLTPTEETDVVDDNPILVPELFDDKSVEHSEYASVKCICQYV